MTTAKLKKYAELTAEINVLVAKQSKLKLEILEDLEKNGTVKKETIYGKFTRSIRKNYTYSEAVKKLSDKLKIAQNKEVEQGIAQVSETVYLTFTPVSEK